MDSRRGLGSSKFVAFEAARFDSSETLENGIGVQRVRETFSIIDDEIDSDSH